MHLPAVPPPTSQVRQVSAQALSQQTRSAQWPEAHSLGAEQVLPSAARQAPPPSHALVPVHVPSVSPLPTGAQEPRLPGRSQDRQFVVQSLPQQVPSTHSPELHSAGAAQGRPLGLGPQLPVVQDRPAAHCAESVHEARQLEPSLQT